MEENCPLQTMVSLDYFVRPDTQITDVPVAAYNELLQLTRQLQGHVLTLQHDLEQANARKLEFGHVALHSQEELHSLTLKLAEALEIPLTTAGNIKDMIFTRLDELGYSASDNKATTVTGSDPVDEAQLVYTGDEQPPEGEDDDNGTVRE